jgi:hypothetical protein
MVGRGSCISQRTYYCMVFEESIQLESTVWTEGAYKYIISSDNFLLIMQGHQKGDAMQFRTFLYLFLS